VLLPLAELLPGLVDLGCALVILLILALVYGAVPGLPLLMLPVFVVMAAATALGAGLWLSALNAVYRDVRYVVPFLIQCLLFASPVAYPSSLVPSRWRWLYELNPLAGVIEGFRWSITGRGQGPGLLLLASSSAVIVLVVSGLAYFRSQEATIVDVV
jgi:lipopolysaccharide transport system permease protein